MSIFLQ